MSNSGSARTSSAGSPTRRDPRYITHDLDALVRQRLYQIAAGTRTSTTPTDSGTIPTFQVVAADGRTTLGSQPTLSRLENAIDWSAIQRLARTGVDWFCAYAYGPDEHPADLILDLDSTDDPTHGTQQLALFHGWYDQHMYHPLVWFEGRTGLLLRTRLRPGRDASATGVVDELRHLLPPLRRRFPHTPIFLRADAGMATPAVEAKLEAEGIQYVLGIGTNRVFKARVAPLVAHAQARYERRERPVHIRTSFRHRAKSWPHHRRILVKIDVTAAGLNVRFMVTNRRGRAADLVAWYDDRGTSENWIKELKLDIHADRLSCHRFRANAFRLQLHSLALLLLAYFRRAVLAGTRLGVGDHRHDSSPPAQSRGARRPQCPTSLVSSRVALARPAALHELSSRARARASLTTPHATDSSTALRRRPEVSSLRTLGGPFGHLRQALTRGLTTSATTVFDLARVVTAGDGAVTDSFVNNAG